MCGEGSKVILMVIGTKTAILQGIDVHLSIEPDFRKKNRASFSACPVFSFVAEYREGCGVDEDREN